MTDPDDWLNPRTTRHHYLQIAAQAEAEAEAEAEAQAGTDAAPLNLSLSKDHPAQPSQPRTWAQRATVRACAALLLAEVIAIGTFLLIQLGNAHG